MKTITGTIKHNELEGGIWELHADDGERYQLAGGEDGLRTEGARVVVEGSIDRGVMGFGMTGPTLAVKRWRAA